MLKFIINLNYKCHNCGGGALAQRACRGGAGRAASLGYSLGASIYDVHIRGGHGKVDVVREAAWIL